MSVDPAATAEAFVRAVVWGEHTVIWELLSPSGRATALSVARQNGLDPVAAGRIESGLTNPIEFEDFCVQLLAGLRRDLRSVEVHELRVSTVIDGESAPGGDTATAELVVPSTIPGSGDWAAGELHLSRQPTGEWLVDRLAPRLARP